MSFTSPILVGREREIEELDRRLSAARQGRGGAVFLLGDPGIGKSRLSADCAYRAFDTGMTVLRGRGGNVSADIPFKPLCEALLSYSRTNPPPDDPALAPYLPALTRLVPEWRRAGIAGHLESVVVLAEAILRLLAVIGRDGGCLLILEDLHEADADTLAVVEYLADNLAETPALLLANLRSHAGPARAVAESCHLRRTAGLIDLAPLPPDQLARLTAACLDVSPEDLPRQLVGRLERDTAGVPFIVEELLAAMAGVGALERDGRRWRLNGDPAIDVPTTLVRSITLRAAHLGPSARDLLHTAAIFGSRFPVPVIQEAAGLDDREVMAFLRSATDARLITPDDSASDWYAFRHALMAEALLSALIPAERKLIARGAADALERLHPGLPGEWCQMAATLRLSAGDALGAAGMLADAGRRLLGDGAADLAVTLLDRAYGMLGSAPADLRASAIQGLLHALTESGEADRAYALAKDLPITGDLAMTIPHEIDLRTKLAWVAAEIGQTADGLAHVAAVRRLLDIGPDEARAAAIDVIEAQLIVPDHGVLQQSPQRMAAAETLVRRAAEVAERVPLPEVACQAWERMALFSRVRGFDEPDRCLTRVLTIADAHGLRLWKLRAMVRLAANHALRTGERDRLEEVGRAAERAGAISLVHTAQASLVMMAVLRGEYGEAHELAVPCVETTIRLGHTAYTQYLLLAQATLAAHQAKRADMELALERFRRWGGENSLHMPVVHGLCQATCALLEEDRDLCAEMLAKARDWEERNPTVYYLTGRYGIGVLMEVLAGRAGRAEWRAADATSAAELAWNRHFLHLADAVLLGRDGDAEGALAAFAAAAENGRPFPLARHLGLRLVAEAALADGWGEPLVWLRTAEEYFHQAGIPAVTGACRAMLRQAGAAVSQRRTGREQVPSRLRGQGVSVREYQVLTLLAERRGNVDIGKRLFISPRTVEKHVASLLHKTGLPDRAALYEHAAELMRRADAADAPMTPP
ncbi:helix-turn-helix transcriptional regulator [Sphaerisporangium rhizosphaerae]|uniref:Helix-turn-helix transcriptional regulator n=1 Tax=Sphaerisporangium rhizosphaerae TaxID=2269375 RepID=A0ABW2P700_9ACTN